MFVHAVQRQFRLTSKMLWTLHSWRIGTNGTCCGSFSFSSGEYVAQFKFTVMLMANGPLRITSGPFEPELYKSEHEVQDPELKVCGDKSYEVQFCLLSLQCPFFSINMKAV